MNNFKFFYDNTKPIIEKSINNFNSNILIERQNLIKENLEIFAKLNNSGKMVRGY